MATEVRKIPVLRLGLDWGRKLPDADYTVGRGANPRGAATDANVPTIGETEDAARRRLQPIKPVAAE